MILQILFFIWFLNFFFNKIKKEIPRILSTNEGMNWGFDFEDAIVKWKIMSIRRMNELIPYEV